MKEIEELFKKQNFTAEEMDSLIIKIKNIYWPKLRDKDMPDNCGLCKLYRACSFINPDLICPWLAYGGK